MFNIYAFHLAEMRGSRGVTPGSWLRWEGGPAPAALLRPRLLVADSGGWGWGQVWACELVLMGSPLLSLEGFLDNIPVRDPTQCKLWVPEAVPPGARTGLEPSGTVRGLLSSVVPSRAVLSEPGRLYSCCP